jgi:NDP-sugar pyrophosphorylase family protein
MGLTGMILAAGRGERMRPLTEALAKPSLPLLGRPLLLRAAGLLARGGLRRLAVNLHHRPDSLRSFFASPPPGIDELHLSLEEDLLLGTGGGARKALPFLREGGEVVLLGNGDSLADLDLPGLFEAHRRGGAAATLVLVEADTERYGAVREREGRVRGFDRLGAGAPAEGRALVFAGWQVVEPTLLERLPEGRPSDLVRDLYAPMLAAGEPLGALVHRGRWLEIGDPGLYRSTVLGLAGEADEEGNSWIGEGPAPQLRDEGVLLAAPGADASHGVFVAGRVVLEEGARAEEGAYLEDSLLLSGARAGPGCRVIRSVLGPGALVPPGLELADAVAVADPDPASPRPEGTRRLEGLRVRALERGPGESP